MKIENQMLKRDNQRLLGLLGSQGHPLPKYAQDAKGVHFIPNKGKPKDQRELWVPQASIKLIKAFSNPGSLTQQILRGILLEMNQAWLQKEKSHVHRVKQQYETKVLDLKRQMFMRQPYDSINSQKIIARLKSQIKKLEQELKSAQKTYKHPGMDQLEITLKLVAELQEQNKHLERTNKILRLKLVSKGGNREPEDLEQLFEESVKMHQVISRLVNDFSVSRNQEMQNKLVGNIERIVKEFSENVEGLVDSKINHQFQNERRVD